MHQPVAVRVLKAHRQLDHAVVNYLEVGRRNFCREVETQSLYELVHVAAVGVLAEREEFAVVAQLLEGRGDVCVRRQVDPLLDVFLALHAAEAELLFQLLVEDYKKALVENAHDSETAHLRLQVQDRPHCDFQAADRERLRDFRARRRLVGVCLALVKTGIH